MFKEKLALVPHLPGSYQMKDKNGTIIYVGKAKDLHRRVSSYFNRTHTGKTAKMVSEVADFTYIVANSEVEAFLIEINLIKQYDPKYNILLKDDKTYPYIEYISKPYPILKVSRYVNVKKKDNHRLFGPYPNAYAARRIVSLLNRLYPLKKCDGMPKNVCLYYHIGECLGYCSKQIDSQKKESMEKEILSFLNGNDKILTDRLEERMEEYSRNLNFEMALELKKELDYVHIVLDKQKIDLSDLVSKDVFAYYLDKGYLSVQLFFIRNGKLVGGHTDLFPVISDVSDELDYYLLRFYQRHEMPKELLIMDSYEADTVSEILPMKFIKPSRGKKKKLVNMALMNAKMNLENELELVLKEEAKTEEANEALKDLLGLEKLDRIDLFDNSNLFGDYSVSGMVVFKNGKPEKKEYRKYKVSVDKNDDYHTMEEVIYRRYYRALLEKSEMPDLILVDGGLNQIHACKNVLDSLHLSICVCGLRKNDKHRTNELIDGRTERLVAIDKSSNVFHYLTRMQDEVHRYTITYHRTIRSKGSISSVLDEIPGIGPNRKKELIKKYGSLLKMEQASVEELTSIVPLKVAEEIKKFLTQRNEGKKRED